MGNKAAHDRNEQQAAAEAAAAAERERERAILAERSRAHIAERAARLAREREPLRVGQWQGPSGTVYDLRPGSMGNPAELVATESEWDVDSDVSASYDPATPATVTLHDDVPYEGASITFTVTQLRDILAYVDACERGELPETPATPAK